MWYSRYYKTQAHRPTICTSARRRWQHYLATCDLWSVLYQESIIGMAQLPQPTLARATITTRATIVARIEARLSGQLTDTALAAWAFDRFYAEELGSEAYDLYFSADRKSRKEKDYSALTMMIAKGLDNFATDSADAALISNAKNYLDSIKKQFEELNHGTIASIEASLEPSANTNLL